MSVAVLFCRKTSHYKKMQSVDCYDVDRDALTWPGGVPGVFHPPCRAWGKLSHFAKARPGEMELSIWAMNAVRKCGGVLEHPLDSRLWSASRCSSWGVRDAHGGLLVPVYQSWWGHRAFKATGLYFVGPVPVLPDYIEPVSSQPVQNMSLARRETTPLALASWLVAYAEACEVSA